MALTSKITEYDERWPSEFNVEASKIAPIFESRLNAIHHVGSTAVEGLAAKPEIDILVTVIDTQPLKRWQNQLTTLGYERGGDLVSGHHFFKRDVGKVRTHKLHVCMKGHPQAVRMLKIRDHLRLHAEDRAAYAELKLRLEEQNKAGIAEYLDAKSPFLDELYERCSRNS